MKLSRYTSLLLFLLAMPCAAQEALKEVTASRTEAIKSGEISVIAEQESVQAKDGGYLANPKVVDCFAEMAYKYTDGRYDNETIKFRFRSPDKVEPGKKYPLVVWMHGTGESGNDNKRQLSHMQSTMEFLAGPHKLDFYILATQCPGDNNQWTTSISKEGKGDAPLTILQEILDRILQNYPIDKDRIGLVGICSGGFGAWPLLEAKPDFFSAATVFSSAVPDLDFWDERYKKTSLWAFNNTDDKSIPVEPMRQAVAKMRNVGSFAYLTERTGGHDSWARAMRDDKVIAWLVLQDREHYSPPPGIVVYPRSNILKPLLLFVLPIALSIPLAFVQIVRRRRGVAAKISTEK